MQALSGVISNRIRGGQLPPDVKLKYQREQEPPSPDAVRQGQGIYLGHGAETRRNGGAS